MLLELSVQRLDVGLDNDEGVTISYRVTIEDFHKLLARQFCLGSYSCDEKWRPKE